MKTFAALFAVCLQLTAQAQFWRPNSDGHFIPVIPSGQNLGASTSRLGEAWITTARLKGIDNQLVIDANSSGQRSAIIFQNQMTNIGAFTFRNGIQDNWYISGYGGLGETFNTYSGLDTNSFLFGEQDGDIFTGRAGSTFYLTNALYLPGKLMLPGYAAQSLLAATAIIATNVNILVTGNGAARTITATPTITAPSPLIDTLIILTGNSDANSITLQDESVLPGSLLRLQAATRTLGLRDKITLLYSVAHGAWEEVSFSGSPFLGVSDAAYDIAWNDDTTTAPSKNAVYDKIETILAGGGLGSTDIDTSAELRTILTDETGAGQLVFADSPTFLDDITIHLAGVRLTGDGDGALTFLGLGDGSDENLTINFDDTANNIVLTTSTGVTNITLTAINLTVPTAVYDATLWNGDLTVPTKDAIRDTIEVFGDIEDDAWAAGWNADLDTPTKNALYDWGHTFDTDDDGLPNVLDSTFTFNGFSISGDGDGAITLLGAGDGSDENLVVNLDDTANNAIVTTSTGLTNITLTAINLTVPAAAYDATAWDGNLTVPTMDAIRDKIETIGGSLTPDTRQGSLRTSDGSAEYWSNVRTDWSVFTDFMMGNLFGENFDDTISGTGAAAQLGNSTYIDQNHFGVCELTSGSQAAGRVAVSSPASANLNQIRLGGGRATFTAIVRIPTLSDGTETYDFRVGYGDSVTTNHVDGVYFEHNATNGFWHLVTANNSSRSFVVTTTALNTAAWMRLDIVVNADGTEVRGYVDGTEVAASSGTYPIVSNIPTASGRNVGVVAALVKSVGTTSRVCALDLLHANVKFTTPR